MSDIEAAAVSLGFVITLFVIPGAIATSFLAAGGYEIYGRIKERRQRPATETEETREHYEPALWVSPRHSPYSDIDITPILNYGPLTNSNIGSRRLMKLVLNAEISDTLSG